MSNILSIPHMKPHHIGDHVRWEEKKIMHDGMIVDTVEGRDEVLSAEPAYIIQQENGYRSLVLLSEIRQ